MAQTRIQLNDVIYNAASQSFEALVSISDGTRSKRYACAIDAPINMSFEQATAGLKTQALRKHASGRGLHSQMRRQLPSQRAGRAAFDPRAWLSSLGCTTRSNAA